MRKIGMFLLLVVILMSGCSTPDMTLRSPTPTPNSMVFVGTEESPFPEPTPGEVEPGDEDECENPFYPVSDEAVWMYASSDGTNSISTMSADDFGKFTITAEGPNSTFTIDGECTEEGITIMQVPGAATTYSGEYGSSTVSTVTVSGVTLPKDVGQGEKWSQIITATTDTGSSVIETNYTAVGFENITVPAGNFYALVVEQSGYVTVFGQKVDMHGLQWFAEGVGVVKSAMDGAPVVELLSYDIPD